MAADGSRRPWHALSLNEVAVALDLSGTEGLAAIDAQARRATYGPNTLARGERASWATVLGRQFQNVLIVILVIAAGISFAVGHIADAMTILAIVVLNGALGFAQEWKAERTLEALRSMLAPLCRVTRDGHRTEMKAELLVPGDLVHVAVGDRIPADLRIVSAANLAADEASLTGESDAVDKASEAVDAQTILAEQTSMAWLGTTITRGRADGLVVATGMQTQFGDIARLTQEVGREPTPLQRKLARLGRTLGIAGLTVSFAVAALGWALGRELLDMFLTGVSLAVAVVPEGLPAVVTITLALGVRTMTRRKALIRRLQAPEALGSATVICTDKTGTLTQSQMTVRRVWTPSNEFETTGVGYDPAGHYQVDGREVDASGFDDLIAILESGQHCNHARVTNADGEWRLIGEPTEGALVVAAYKAELVDVAHDRPGTTEYAFDSDRKRMTVVEERPEGRIAYVKGAPEIIVERTTSILEGGTERALEDRDREQVLTAMAAMAESGLRTLAIAIHRLDRDTPLSTDTVENELTLLGIVGMYDPPRPGVSEAVALARSAGVRTIMITGDAPATALAIGRQVGIPAERAITGADLAAMDEDALTRALAEPVVFARTTPAHKLRIVTALQRGGEIVGMTGDGVNDAPALKKADIGIAMGIRGTDVAKGAADIILTDDNYASIISAVEEGRRQFANIQKFVRYLLSSNLGEVVAILVNIVLGGPLILIPVQILWMNLVTDSATAIALGVEPVDRDAMKGPPRNPTQGVLDAAGARQVLLLGSYIGIVTVVLFYAYLNAADERMNAVAQTIAFTAIIVAEKINVLNFRVLNGPISNAGFFSNRWLLAALGGMLALQVCAVYVPFLQDALHTVPLETADWLLIVGATLPIFFIAETLKRLRYGRTSP